MFGWKKKKAVERILEVPAPLPGKVLPLAEVPDEAFAGGLMGEGIAIQPVEGKVTAPFAGKVVHVMEKSKHAVMLEHESGTQILIHVGMNTVSLKGEGFTAHVNSGDSVAQGQLLLEFDIPAIEQAGYTVITPVIVPAGQEHIKRIEVAEGQTDGQQGVIRIYY
ncbi:PTS glucose transporter subunit IIA [Paenibacillus macerans]|uniref:PTS sugar transporter subunit IIA n=1 Tax=Paenibacillus macerans TaxID=44252 RepID=UPI00203DF408|nr:PTS glucose transporter subunit IIA [Paenibacillus macerans]MCM3702149.1 PTS glucose transporter subunit IIA [Paenibacillus macerans]